MKSAQWNEQNKNMSFNKVIQADTTRGTWRQSPAYFSGHIYNDMHLVVLKYNPNNPSV